MLVNDEHWFDSGYGCHEGGYGGGGSDSGDYGCREGRYIAGGGESILSICWAIIVAVRTIKGLPDHPDFCWIDAVLFYDVICWLRD
jgi:hypothetical protein